MRLSHKHFLKMKRKSSMPTVTDIQNKKTKQDETSSSGNETASTGTIVNPILANIFNRSMDGSSTPVLVSSLSAPSISDNSCIPAITGSNTGKSGYQALAQRAAGHGIRHKFHTATAVIPPKKPESSGTTRPLPMTAPPSLPTQMFQPSLKPSSSTTNTASSSTFALKEASNANLSQLECNYRSSLNQSNDALSILYNIDADPTPLSQMRDQDFIDGPGTAVYGSTSGTFSHHDSSLVDLAMFLPCDGTEFTNTNNTVGAGVSDSEEVTFDFIDFPNPDLFQDHGFSPDNLSDPD